MGEIFLTVHSTSANRNSSAMMLSMGSGREIFGIPCPVTGVRVSQKLSHLRCVKLVVIRGNPCEAYYLYLGYTGYLIVSLWECILFWRVMLRKYQHGVRYRFSMHHLIRSFFRCVDSGKRGRGNRAFGYMEKTWGQVCFWKKGKVVYWKKVFRIALILRLTGHLGFPLPSAAEPDCLFAYFNFKEGQGRT